MHRTEGGLDAHDCPSRKCHPRQIRTVTPLMPGVFRICDGVEEPEFEIKFDDQAAMPFDADVAGIPVPLA